METKETILKELQQVMGPENVSTDDTELSIYSRTWGMLERFRFKHKWVSPKADFVVYPENVDQISQIMKLANRYKIPVIPYGGGSAANFGGVIPIYGGIILETKRLDAIKRIDEDSMTVTAEAGINLFKLEDELNKHGYTHNHFGGGFYCTTLGGGIATNGAGRLSTRYGKIGDCVTGMQVVLPNGEIIKTIHAPRHSTGPELNRFFIGSEGILGIITEATIKIFPLPEKRLFKAFLFPSFSRGFRAARTIIKKGIRPAVMRLHDENAYSMALEYRKMREELSLPEKGAILILMLEGLAEVVNVEEKIVSKICSQEEAIDLGEKPAKFWWDHRYYYFYPQRGKRPFLYHTFETSVTYDKFEEAYHAFKDVLLKKCKDLIIMNDSSHWWHNGASMYFRIALENAPDNRHPFEVLEDLREAWARTVFKFGGVFSHHHCTGTDGVELLKEQYGPAYTVLVALKKALDPNNIMNPGKLLEV